MKIYYDSDVDVIVTLTHTINIHIKLLDTICILSNSDSSTITNDFKECNITDIKHPLLINALEYIEGFKKNMYYFNDIYYIPIQYVNENFAYCIRITLTPRLFITQCLNNLTKSYKLNDNPIYNTYTLEQQTNFVELLFNKDTEAVARQIINI